MITVVLFRKREQFEIPSDNIEDSVKEMFNYRYLGFNISGHAFYDDPGKDIVCSAVSVLAYNTANSLDSLTTNEFFVEIDEDEPYFECMLKEDSDELAQTLLRSLHIGIVSILDEYQLDDETYITLKFEEV